MHKTTRYENRIPIMQIQIQRKENFYYRQI